MKQHALSFLLLVATGLAVTACNEKISPELENGANTSTGVLEVPSTYLFKVENASESYLNYHIHRTGANRSYTKCEISKTTAFTATNYGAEGLPAIDHDSKTYDITCLLEAEELALYFSGLSFKFSASKNTCDYVGYAPYSYYGYMPGSSSRTVSGKLRTDEDAGCALEAPVIPTTSGNLGCGDVGESYYAETTYGAAAVQLSDETLCSFDYSASGGPNCDSGEIDIVQYSYSYNTDLATTEVTVSNRKHYCGGAPANCISGPIKLIPSFSNDAIQGSEIYRTEANETFTSTIDLPAPILQNLRKNIGIVNFRRDLANDNIDYGVSDLDYVGSSTINYDLDASFDPSGYATGQTYAKKYEPLVVSRYSAGKNTSTGAADAALAAAVTTFSTAAGYTRTPYASDAFRGLSSYYRTQPFYTFYCFDNAFEVRARIRMMIRDWDRVYYPDTNKALDYFALISDIDNASAGMSRIHNPYSFESQIDNDSYNVVNDVASWEDLIYMTTDGAGVYRPSAGYITSGSFPGE